MNIEKSFKGKGGYVFVSHSHLDIDKVREIRNYLEKEGMEPILFYLRCMDGGDADKLASLKQLIFDEIDSREFFLYVNSQNAAASEWVQEELAYIRATHPDRLVSVDIAGGKASAEQTLSRMVRGMRVFISASARDRELTHRLTDALVARDFRVYDVNNAVMTGESWMKTIAHTIADLAEEGLVIALITRASLTSAFVRDELAFALEKRVPVVPIVVGDAFDQGEARGLRLRIPRWISLPEDPTDQEIAAAVRDVVVMCDRLFAK